MELIEQIFELYIKRNYPPDILSVEYGSDENGINENGINDKRMIRFEWFSGKSREFGYTSKSYGAIWDRFNSYWNTRKEGE